jgi:hypothetical protein
LATPHHPGRLGLQAHQLADRVVRLSLGARFQHLPHQDQCDDDRRGVKVDRVQLFWEQGGQKGGYG